MNIFFKKLLKEVESLNQSLIAYDTLILKQLKQRKSKLEWITLILVIISLSTAFLIAYLIIRQIINSLETLKDSLLHIAKGNHDLKVPLQNQRDEIGEISRAIHQLKIKSIERKGFESANLAIKERLEHMLESAPVGLLEVDMQGNIIMANKAFIALFGYSNAELAGKKVETLLPKEFREKHVHLRDSFINEGKSRLMSNGRVVTAQDRHGHIKHLQISLSNIKNEMEEYIIASVLDVTNLRTLQDELIDQSSLFESMVRDAPEAIVIAYPNRQIRTVNPMFTHLFGYQSEEAIGRKTLFLYESEEAFNETGRKRYNIEGSSDYQAYEIQYKKKDGSLFLSETVGGAIKSPEGDVLGYMAFIRDITERKSHENILANYQKQIEESNQRLQLATQSANTGIWEFDLITNKLHWDSVMHSIYGLPPEKFTESYEDWAQLVLPDDLEKTTAKFSKAIENVTQYESTFKIQHPDLGIRYIEAYATPQVNSNGIVERMVGVNRDITEKEEQQLQLSRNHKLLSAISRAQQQFIGDSNIRSVFDALLMDILEITGSEYGFIGEILYKEDQTPYLKTHAISNIAWNDETQKFYEDNAPQGLEFYNLKTLFGEVLTSHSTVISNYPKTHPASGGLPEGHPALNAFLGQPFFSGNKIMGMVGIANRENGYDQELVEFLDPLWRTLGQLIEALRMDQVRSEQEQELNQLALVASKTNNAVIITDKDGFIKWVNEAFTEISGYLFDEVIGKKPGDLLQGPHTDPDTIEYMSESLKNGDAFQAELINYHKDGTEYWLFIEVQPVKNSNGEITDFIAVESDITQKKHAEKELHDAVARAESFAIKAEQASIAKSEFLANMSHEIRTPMNGVLGMLNLLSRGSLDDQQLQYTQMAHTSAESLLTIINDILDFSKIEAGKLDLEVLSFDLEKLVQDFLKTFKYRANEKGIQVSLNIEKLESKMVLGDPGRLLQILNNLCSNALKFTDDGYISISIHQKENRITFTIEDSGIGIPTEKIETLFNKFTQADGSTTRKYGGTGLGLSICKQLCEMMDGDISATSIVNKGSTFKFHVSLPPCDKESLLNTSLPKFSGHRAAVLESDVVNLTVIEDLLQSWGLSIIPIQDLSSKLDVELMLIDRHRLNDDLSLPITTNGCEVILLTTNKDEFSSSELFEHKISAQLGKPIDHQELHQTISLLLSPEHSPHEIINSQELQTISDELPKILLVEDNLINQEVAKGIIEDLGYIIDTAENGQEAIEILNTAHNYKLVLMDCQMPIMDGYECTGAIRKGDAGEENIGIPIIAMTANAMKGDEEKCLAAGMDDYLTKPLDIIKLEESLLKWSTQTKD